MHIVWPTKDINFDRIILDVECFDEIVFSINGQWEWIPRNYISAISMFNKDCGMVMVFDYEKSRELLCAVLNAPMVK